MTSVDRPHVLVVEDDHAVGDVLRRYLEQSYEVTVATDGVTGLAAARDLAPDLIVLDVMLPKFNGLEICRELRETDSSAPAGVGLGVRRPLDRDGARQAPAPQDRGRSGRPHEDRHGLRTRLPLGPAAMSADTLHALVIGLLGSLGSSASVPSSSTCCAVAR